MAVQLDMTLEARKAFATVDLVLDFLIVRMREVSGTYFIYMNFQEKIPTIVKISLSLGLKTLV